MKLCLKAILLEAGGAREFCKRLLEQGDLRAALELVSFYLEWNKK